MLNKMDGSILCVLPQSLDLKKAFKWTLLFDGKKISIQYFFRDRSSFGICRKITRVHFGLDTIDFIYKLARTNDYLFSLEMKKMAREVPKIVSQIYSFPHATMVLGIPPRLKWIDRIRQFLS